MKGEQMIKMVEKIKNLFIFIMLGIMPLLLHFSMNIIFVIEFEYLDYYFDIYFFNAFTFAYIYTCFINKHILLNKFTESLMLIASLDFIMSTMLYTYTYIQIIDKKESVFIILCVLAVFNLLIDMIISITYIKEDDDSDHNVKDIYEKYSENRYERYLLERIDEKLNLIKNQQSEKSEEKSDDTVNSEELLNGSDILAEMLKNHIEIQEYFQISKNQSKFSFYFSISSSVVGIIVVIIAASGIVIFKNLGISIIAAVSGAITEIISGIVLWIHNKSALQLNYYYDSLHENEKFLSALNIADKLSEEKREDMYMEIIRKQIDIQSKDKMNKISDADKK